MPHATTQVNGHGQTLLPAGVYAPLNTFFHPDTEELDLDTFKAHALRIAQAGVGLVVAGSMGEAHHLTREERKLLIQTAREVLNTNSDLEGVQLVAGTGGNSTRETIALTKDAAEAGADSAMVIAPGYFAGALGAKALKTFFVDVAAASPIPVIIYNFPGAASGLDLNSDLIAEIVAAAPNIIGVKLTCGSVGKLTRLVSLRPSFVVLGGFVDFLGPSLMMKAAGGITGLANLAPKTCLKLYTTTLSALSATPGSTSAIKDLAAAASLQELVSAGDWALQKGGISGTKYALEQAFGYGGVPRRPILGYVENGGDGKQLMEELRALVEYEKAL